MKKTVQIVTIPLGKEGWRNEDLILYNPKDGRKSFYMTAVGDGQNNVDEFGDTWQAQQLLVLSNDEIQENCDWYLDDTNQLRKNVVFDKEYWSTRKKYKAVLASYPQLPNTLPISKETVQAWIDSGTPVEGRVETITKDEAKRIWLLCGIDGKIDDNDYNEKPCVGPQGNLLLEFEEEIHPVEEAILQALEENHLPINDDFAEGNVAGAIFGAEWQKEQNKPSISTDYEILLKSLEHSNNLYNADDKSKDYALSENQLWENSLRDYEAGYKQALKDLGYE
jgi:hypothetical protein